MVLDKLSRQYSRKLAMRLVIVAMAAFCFVSSVSAQPESCPFCKPRVYVAFNGAFCSSGHFNMYVSGTLVASGAAVCDGASYARSNNVIAGLIVDVTYQIQVVNACSTHINFYDIPEDYYLEVEGKERRTIDKAGTGLGDGDGIWNITVRRKCKCGNGNGGESAGPAMGSIMWDVGLGKLSDGRGAGSLGIHAETLQAFHYQPTSLIYSPPGYTNEVEVIRNPVDFGLRQVKSPETLADVVVINSDKYEIRFYRNADVGPKDQNGFYTFSNQPFVTWRVENPHPGFVDQLKISKIQGAVTQSSLYTFNSGTNTWTLTSGNGERIDTKVTTIAAGTGDKTETYTVTNGSGQLISKVSRTYHQFTWPKQELIQEVVDPDGAALTTTYAYYENSSETGRFMRLQSVTKPDGSWEQYDYDPTGVRTLVLRPWKDQPLATATESNSYAIRTTYSNYDGIETTLDAKFVSSVEEKILGVTVKKTTYSRAGTTVNGEPAVVETQTSYWASASGLTTIITKYHSSASNFFVNRIASIQFPDGRKDTYVYEKGNYVTNADPSLNTFTVDANGLAQRDTVIHGTVLAPDGVGFKTTKATTIRDQFGHAALQEMYVYTGNGYDRTAWAVMDYDDHGHLTQTRRSNGTISSSTWDGDLKTADVDESGIETDYTYDSLNRVATSTRKGVPAAGGFPAQADVVTTFTYDAEGRVKAETTTASGLSITRAATYDVAGRTKTETDSIGLVTTHLYTNGGRTETLTLPGGATRLVDQYLDKQIKTVLGSAVVGRFFDYGANSDGTRFKQEYVGSAGASSPRWTKTTIDWFGRTIKVERPSFIAGTTVSQLSAYNSTGQLQSESIMAGVSKLVADKFYEYDVLGNNTRVALDIDNNGTITLASTDRISDTDTIFQQNGNDWSRLTTTTTYLTNGDATPTTVATQSERLNNFAINGTENTISDVITTDVANNLTHSTIVVDRAARKLTARTDSPDSATDAVTISYNGLLQSSAPSEPSSATTYTYDALGRSLGISDPATGSNTTTYDPITGQVLSESHGSQTTTYEYYSPAQANAGRLKVRTNPAGKKVYFNYNSRGDMVQTWGNTTYPLEYVFDAYGQQTELHTFRGGSGWQGASWPVSTLGAIDITRWTYHEATGLLMSKRDASSKDVQYTYDTLGRTVTRKWARLNGGNQVTTTYTYDPQSAETTVITYSDGTQPLGFVYDRGGRVSSVTDAAGSHTLTYNAAGQFQSEAIAGGLLDGINVSAGYDGFLRRNSLQATRNATTLISQTYGYDASSRLETVTSGSQTAAYAYYPTNGLLNTTTFAGGTQISRTYDPLGRLQTIATASPTQGTVASYAYTYNNLDQRARVTREDNSYWSYIYDDRGQLISDKKHWSDDAAVAGQQMEYAFDSIGNRTSTKAGGNEQGLNLRQTAYTANALNQYQERSVPGAIDVRGTANAAATVTVNDQATYRRGDYFYKELTVDNSLTPAYPQVKAVGVRSGAGGGGEDAVTQIDGKVYVPKNVELYTYDADGNLTSDGRWVYTWDAENRVTSMQAVNTAPVTAKLRLEFAYDYMGRRIQKKVYVWNAGTGSYQLQSVLKMINDGWNIVAELDGANALVRNYVRSTQGSGDTFGLLMINEGSDTYLAGYDGNTNVGVLVKAGDGGVAASYDYSGFGETVKTTGSYAARNPIRYSGAYTDVETGLVYFGFRYYNPQTGRWIGRDPSEETGGINLYGFLNNNSANATDFLGLWKAEGAWTGRKYKYTGRAVAECDDEKLSDLAKLITGNKSDARFLSSSGKIKTGDSIDIAPLLVEFESRIRAKVVIATTSLNTVFPETPAEVAQATNVTVSTKGEAGRIKKYFGRKRYGFRDCNTAALLIFAKALVDVLGGDTFNKLGYGDTSIPVAEYPGKLEEMMIGDWGFFQNYDDYLEKMQSLGYGLAPFQGENFIKLGDNKFRGLPTEGDKTEAEWNAYLRDQYNSPQHRPEGKQRTDKTPGFNNLIRFIDVAKVALDAFTLRHK